MHFHYEEVCLETEEDISGQKCSTFVLCSQLVTLAPQHPAVQKLNTIGESFAQSATAFVGA